MANYLVLLLLKIRQYVAIVKNQYISELTERIPGFRDKDYYEHYFVDKIIDHIHIIFKDITEFGV